MAAEASIIAFVLMFRVRSAVTHTKTAIRIGREVELYHRPSGLSNATHPGVSIAAHNYIPR